MAKGDDDQRATAARLIRQLLMTDDREALQRLQGSRLVENATVDELERLRAVFVQLSTWLAPDATRHGWDEHLVGLEEVLGRGVEEDSVDAMEGEAEEPGESEAPSKDAGDGMPERLDLPAAGPAPLPVEKTDDEEDDAKAPVPLGPVPPPPGQKVPHVGMSAEEAVQLARRAVSGSETDAVPPAPLRPPPPPPPPELRRQPPPPPPPDPNLGSDGPSAPAAPTSTPGATSSPPSATPPAGAPASGLESSIPPASGQDGRPRTESRPRASTVAVLPNAAELGALPFSREPRPAPPKLEAHELLEESGETAPGVDPGRRDPTVALQVPPPPQAHPFGGGEAHRDPHRGEPATSQMAFGSLAFAFAIGIDEHATLTALGEHAPQAAREMEAACGISGQSERATIDRMVETLCESIEPLQTAWERSYARAIAALDQGG